MQQEQHLFRLLSPCCANRLMQLGLIYSCNPFFFSPSVPWLPEPGNVRSGTTKTPHKGKPQPSHQAFHFLLRLSRIKKLLGDWQEKPQGLRNNSKERAKGVANGMGETHKRTGDRKWDTFPLSTSVLPHSSSLPRVNENTHIPLVNKERKRKQRKRKCHLNHSWAEIFIPVGCTNSNNNFSTPHVPIKIEWCFLQYIGYLPFQKSLQFYRAAPLHSTTKQSVNKH